MRIILAVGNLDGDPYPMKRMKDTYFQDIHIGDANLTEAVTKKIFKAVRGRFLQKLGDKYNEREWTIHTELISSDLVRITCDPK